MDPVKAYFVADQIITEDSDPARELYAKNTFGTIKNSKVILSSLETLYLVEKGKLIVLNRNKPYTYEQLINKFRKEEKQVMLRYAVFRDLRDRGYNVKTALKFGAEFRVYDKGVKPGEDHAKWIVYPVPEAQGMTWYDFSAKNRVAHSTKKRLLIAIVDAEYDVTYYEIKWMRP